MRPSEVRTRVLSDHAALRRRLDTLSELCAELDRGELRDVGPALAVARELRGHLADHFALEDTLLSPALRARDSWGPVRADNLEEHHKAQRQQLKILDVERAHADTPESLARALLVFIDELRVDMAYEERELLTRELLNDEFQASDGEDG